MFRQYQFQANRHLSGFGSRKSERFCGHLLKLDASGMLPECRDVDRDSMITGSRTRLMLKHSKWLQIMAGNKFEDEIYRPDI